MPIYDYLCHKCRARVSIRLSYAEYDTAQPNCPKCGSNQLVRRIGRVRVARSTDQRLDTLSDPSQFDNIDENDPRAMGQMLRQMAAESGEELGSEFEDVVGRLESGEDPAEIEASLGDLSGGGLTDDE